MLAKSHPRHSMLFLVFIYLLIFRDYFSCATCKSTNLHNLNVALATAKAQILSPGADRNRPELQYL